jgi:hypothetical protein
VDTSTGSGKNRQKHTCIQTEKKQKTDVQRETDGETYKLRDILRKEGNREKD